MKHLENNINNSQKRSKLKGERLGRRLIGSVGVAMCFTVTIAIFLIFLYGLAALETQVATKAINSIEILKATHTQSMIHRGTKLDDNPVIDAMNGTMEQLSLDSKKTKFWLYMGPKVLKYQQEKGSEEIEPPIDQIDWETLKQKKPLGQLVSDTIYRYSYPVILGQREASHEICGSCHGKDMGINTGEVIGGFSVAYDFTEEKSEFTDFMIQIIVFFVLFLSVTAYLILENINILVTKPILKIEEVLNKITTNNNNEISVSDELYAKVNQEQELNRTVEIDNIIDAIDLLNQHNQSQLSQFGNALNSHAIVSRTNLEGEITYVNQKFIDISGYRESELLGSNHRLFNSKTHSHDYFVSMYECIYAAKTWHGEFCNRSKDGQLYWVDSLIMPVLSKNGELQSFLEVQTEITQIKQAQIDSAKAKKLAEQSLEAKSTFFASMSHEIRTPMNGVIGMLGLVEQSDLSQKQRHRINIAKSSANSLLNLINDILDFSKMDSGNLELEMINFDLAKTLGDTAESLAHEAQGKNIELLLDLSQVTETYVKGDPYRLRQCVTNLINNAIKFTEKGEVILKVTLTETFDRRWCLNVNVKDTGIGIPENKLEMLFESFSQVDASTTREYGGTGLGLAIVKKLVGLMGGDVAISSKVGKGSQFSFNVFLEKIDCSLKDLEKVNLKGVNVLVVDDNMTNSNIIGSQIELWGGKSTLINSLSLSVEHLYQLVKNKKANYDLALIDSQLIEREKYEIVKKLKTELRHHAIKIVRMTSINDIQDDENFPDSRECNSFPKPTTTRDLFKVINLVNENSQAQPSDQQTTHLAVTQGKLVEIDKTTYFKLFANTKRTLSEVSEVQVLIVDDNPVNQLVAKGSLNKLGMKNIETANDGIEAIECISQRTDNNRFEIVFMDCQMPRMDGFETTKQIRAGAAGEKNKEIKIIAMTANAMAGDKEICLQAGMNDYLSKPLNLEHLKDKLNL